MDYTYQKHTHTDICVCMCVCMFLFVSLGKLFKLNESHSSVQACRQQLPFFGIFV